MVEAVNALFGRARAQFVFDEIPFHRVSASAAASDRLSGDGDVPAPLRIAFIARANIEEKRANQINRSWTDRELPGMVAREISRLLDRSVRLGKRPVEARDIAVLCRTNRQAMSVQDALRRIEVPSVLHTRKSVFDTTEAEQVERVLAAMVDPGESGTLRAALVTELVGLNGDELARFEDDERQLAEWLGRFRMLREIWLSRGFIAAFHLCLDEVDAYRRLLSLPDGERRMTNVLHVAELLHRAAIADHLAPPSVVRFLRRMRAEASARRELAEEAAQIRIESDEAAVKILTVHVSKGLEFPVVICPYLWDLRGEGEGGDAWFHDREEDDTLTLDLGSEDVETHREAAATEAFAESVRLVYVALTRAQHHCVVFWGGFRQCEKSPLAYLLHQAPAEDGEGDPRPAVIRRVRDMDDRAMREDIERLVRRANGNIELRDIPSDEKGLAHLPEREEPARLRCRRARRALEDRPRTSSYTALTRGAERSGDEDGAVDRDAVAGVAAARSAGDAVPGEHARVLLSDFPAGPTAGRCLHKIFEQLDFSAAGAAEVRRIVAASLEEFGFESLWSEPVASAIGEILDTPLPGSTGSCALRGIPRGSRLSELEFLFPVGRACVPAGERVDRAEAVTAEQIAALLERHRCPAVMPEYARRVAGLGFSPLSGYLNGFIDLLFKCDDRWYVVDYKSNHLGPQAGDYAPALLAAEMARHHYFLQYYLYVVAVHRYLGRHIAGYDYERHFGGVYYLFLRGMSPRRPAGCGVFADRPPAALVDDLSRLVGGAGGGGGAP